MSRAWMPMYWGDYLADTQHLTTLQHGAYILLIAHYWQHGKLPTDNAGLRRITGLTGKLWASNCLAIAALFDENWRHKRIEAELEKARIIREKRSISGQIGGFVSRGKNNSERYFGKAFAKQTGHQSQRSITTTFSVAAKGQPESQLAEVMKRKGWVP